MDKLPVSVMMVVRNEAARISRCLGSVGWADEIVIIDQSSDDNTVELCRRYTDKVFTVAAKGYCEPDRLLALSKAVNEWVLYLDADEVVSDALRQRIAALLGGRPQFDRYYIARKNIFLGRWIKGSGWSPGYVLRFFKKSGVAFSERIHTDVIALGPCGYISEPIEHYTCEDLEEYLAKANRYSSILARQAYAAGARVRGMNVPLKAGIEPVAMAARKYFLQCGFRDGWQGAVIACLTALTIFMRNVKVWEMGRMK